MPKATLSRISESKRERVVAEAAKLFAERGYSQTDMELLARRAKVAKGSLYNYFDSKQELYEFVCRRGLSLSRQTVYGEMGHGWDVYRKVEHIFRQGVRFARRHPEFVALYFNVGAAGMQSFAESISVEVEQYTANLLMQAIQQGVADGTVRPDIDPQLAAFLINNTYVLLMAALASRHFEIRLQVYLEVVGPLTDEVLANRLERTISQLHQLLRPAAANVR